MDYGSVVCTPDHHIGHLIFNCIARACRFGWIGLSPITTGLVSEWQSYGTG